MATYINKLPDGTIRRHDGEPVGEGEFILLEPSFELCVQVESPVLVVEKAEPIKDSSFGWAYLVAAVLGAAVIGALWVL